MKRYYSLLAIALMFSMISTAQDVDTDRAYGENLITFKPFVGYASSQLIDVAVGLGYERFLNQYISVKVPLNIGLANGLFQTGAGVKFYPWGHTGLIRYAVGPTLLYSTAKSDGYVSQVDNAGIYSTYPTQNSLAQFGLLVSNSANITVSKNFYLGLDMGLGLNYLNNFTYDTQGLYPGAFHGNGTVEDPGVIFQFNIELGYRF